MSIIYLAALASAVTLVPTSPDQPRQASVVHSDIELSSEAGRDKLDRRLKEALNMVCDQVSNQSLDEQESIRKCRKRAMAQIAPQRELAIANSGKRLAGKF